MQKELTLKSSNWSKEKNMIYYSQLSYVLSPLQMSNFVMKFGNGTDQKVTEPTEMSVPLLGQNSVTRNGGKFN